ncbi:type VI secretion system tip protein TssI/VgrG [Salinicola sp. JS01]|uniref:type VI secretion system Vgr family protein n=1 Tax=Salinicola sp. JS01 TaxID=3050071 RepID=UPI00255BEA48|nr:type VI secretion system tip protein TssI/VgrG [Salinicola sp. JS01]WIX32094.1 type VI secretion system tip protein TssI/VgrG [Salinicola sp. JS01]
MLDISELSGIDLSQSQRLLQLDLPGAPGGVALIPHRLVGEERVCEPFAYTLDCISQQNDIELKTLMAQPARLSILQADGSYRPLHGLVYDAALLGEDGGVSYYQLTLVPWLRMLELGRDNRIFQNASVVDILTDVFADFPPAAGRWRFDLRRDYPTRSYCVQYRESDLNFISRITEEEGLWYYIEQSDDGHCVVFTDDTDTTAPVSPQAIRFHRQDATETEDALTHWGGTRTQQPTRVSLGSFDYKQPALAKRTGLGTINDQGNLPPRELYDYAGEYYYRGVERGERLAENRLEALESQAKRFHGAGGARQLQAGRWFELTQHPLHDAGGEAERTFLLLGVIVHAENVLPVSAHLKTLPGSLQPRLDAARRAHGIDDPEASTGDDTTDVRRVGTGHFLVDLEAQRRSQPYRHPLTHPRPVIGGPQTATVVGPEGEEIHTDEWGRVKVQFHWDRQGQHDEQSSCWLRVASSSAGAGHGYIRLPRVGEEVLTEFLEGDPDRPLITGSLYNGQNSHPWGLPDSKTCSGFRSKTYQGSGFNALRFDDQTDQEQIWLHAQKNFDLLTLNDRTEEIKRDNTLHVYRDRTTDIDRDDTRTVQRHDTHTVHGNETLSVDGNETHTIHQHHRHTTDGNETKRVGRNWSTKVGNHKTETVGKAYLQNVGLGRMENVGLGYSLNVGALMNTVVGLSHTTQVGLNHALDVGRDITLNAGNRLTLQVGNSRLVITGEAIYLDAGEIHVRAGTNVHIDGPDDVFVNTGTAQPAPGSDEADEDDPASEGGSGRGASR